MIEKFKKGNGTMVQFGHGTVSVKPYALKTRYGGQIEMMNCSPSKIGSDPRSLNQGSHKVVLDFSNVESLDVVIEKLQTLRELMK